MSTAIVTPNPETMPIEELRAAVVAGNEAPPVAPVAEPTPVPAPVVEPPKAYELNPQADGSVVVKLQTGEEFKGSAEEVLRKMAEAHVNTKRWGQEWKQKAETVPAVPVAPVTPPVVEAPVENAEDAATRNWLGEQLAANPEIARKVVAAALGISPDQLPAKFGTIDKYTSEIALNTEFANFNQACPDYVDTTENAEVLGSYFCKPGDPNAKPEQIPLAQWPPTSWDLKRAYTMAVYDKKITPAQAAQTPAPGRVPPPMPTSSAAPVSTGAVNPWAMPLDELKRNAFGQ